MKRRFVAWLAIIGIACNALWPLLANAAPADLQMTICTTDKSAQAAQSAPAKRIPASSSLPHCPFCLGVSDTTPVAGTRVRFSGRACPPHDGVWARIQRRTAAGTFATVNFVRLVDDPARPGCSKYNRLVRVGADGVYRASVPGDADHLAGASSTRMIVVH